MKEPTTKQLILILAAGSLTTMAGGVVAPVLPDIKEQLNLDPVFAGNLVSMHCLTIALFSPLLGMIADKISPIRVLVPALFCYGIAGSAGAFMTGFWSLLATRALLGAAAGGIAATSLGLLTGMYQGEARSQALGYATATLTITGIIYPILGGLVGNYSWQFAFYLYSIAIPLALLAAALFPFKLTAPNQNQNSGLRKRLLQILTRPPVWRLLLIIGLASVAMYAVSIYAPSYLRDILNLSTSLNGIVLGSRVLGAGIISAFGAKPLAKAIGIGGATGVGFGIVALTLSSIPILTQFYPILFAALLFGFGFGLVLPNLYNTLANLAPHDMRSSILAAGIGSGFLGQFLSPIILAPVQLWGGLETVFYGAAIIAMGAGLLLASAKNLAVDS